MTHKRTKKDVEEAYRRGFEAGFMVRPNPFTMLLRSLWHKHELKKLKKAWRAKIRDNGGISPVWNSIHSESIGFVKSFNSDENGLTAEIQLGDKRDSR